MRPAVARRCGSCADRAGRSGAAGRSSPRPSSCRASSSPPSAGSGEAAVVDIHDDALPPERRPRHRDVARPGRRDPGQDRLNREGVPLARRPVGGRSPTSSASTRSGSSSHRTAATPRRSGPRRGRTCRPSRSSPGRRRAAGSRSSIEAVRIARRARPRHQAPPLAGRDRRRQPGLSRRPARRRLASEPWIEIGQTPYGELGPPLGRATVICIPTPGHAYWDSVAPVKLFDCLAAGRPIVTTPRPETAAIVRDRRSRHSWPTATTPRRSRPDAAGAAGGPGAGAGDGRQCASRGRAGLRLARHRRTTCRPAPRPHRLAFEPTPNGENRDRNRIPNGSRRADRRAPTDQPGRHHRPRLRRPAARDRVRRGRPRRRGDRRQRPARRGAVRRPLADRRHLERAPRGGARAAGSRVVGPGRASHLADADVIVVCVPTPITRSKDPDLGPVLSAAALIREHLRAGQLVDPPVDDVPGHDDRTVPRGAGAIRPRRPATTSTSRSPRSG